LLPDITSWLPPLIIALHDDRGAAVGRLLLRMQPVDEALLQRTGAGKRRLRQESGIGTEPDRHDGRKHRDPETAPHPFADAERPFHRLVHPPADQQRHSQRRRRTQRIGEQQQGRADARPLQGSTGEDEPEHGTGAGRPEQSGRHAEQSGRDDGRATAAAAPIGRLRQPCAKRYQRSRQIIRQRWEE
jgi:hypothetical protein